VSDDVTAIGNVILLGNFKAQKNAPPSLVVERINESCRWVTKEKAKCQYRHYRHGFPCYRLQEFVVSTLGAKHGWGICAHCLGDFCASILERPKAEAEELAREEIERAQRHVAQQEAKKAHADAKLCQQYSRSAPFNLCPRSPKFVDTDGKRYCARHAVRPRKRKWGAQLVPLAS
jgi:hypothetical protein